MPPGVHKKAMLKKVSRLYSHESGKDVSESLISVTRAKMLFLCVCVCARCVSWTSFSTLRRLISSWTNSWWAEKFKKRPKWWWKYPWRIPTPSKRYLKAQCRAQCRSSHGLVLFLTSCVSAVLLCPSITDNGGVHEQTLLLSWDEGGSHLTVWIGEFITHHITILFTDSFLLDVMQ